MGRITSFSKQVIVFVLALTLITRPAFASNVGGWTLGGGVPRGSSTVYNGTKNIIINGADYVKKGTAIVTPTAIGVAKVLSKSLAGFALSVAVEQLLGAVDWVLDSENNRIIYYEDGSPDSNNSKAYYIKPGTSSTKIYITGMPDDALCKQLFKTQYIRYVYVSATGPLGYCQLSGNTGADLWFYSNPAYDPTKRPEKYLPLETVAAQVISNAESGDSSAQVATIIAADTIVEEAEKDSAKARPIVDQLEASSETKSADAAAAEKANDATGQQTKNPDNPDTTDIKITFPVFCGWAPTVCEAAQTVISFPKTLTEWWQTGKSKVEEWALSISEAWTKVKEEYANKPTENTDTQLDLPDQSPPDINTDISFGGSCPASRSVPVSFAGIHTEIEFSFQWFCDVASIAKPVVISISAFAAALIVAGVRTEDD